MKTEEWVTSGMTPPHGDVPSFPRLLMWLFFAPHKLIAYEEEYGLEIVRQISAWPAAALAWFPWAIPPLLMSLGVVQIWHEPAYLLLLDFGVAAGWILTGLLCKNEHSFSQNTFWILLGSYSLLLVTGVVLVIELVLIITSIRNSTLEVGIIMIGAFVLAVTLAVGVAMALRAGIAFVIPLIGIILLPVIILANWPEIPFEVIFEGSFVIGTTIVAPLTVMNVLKSTNNTVVNTILRVGILIILILSNMAFILIFTLSSQGG